jgi:hypothetical protein
MMFLTVSDALAEIKPVINGGQCKDDTAIARVNQATRRLMARRAKPIHIRRTVRFFTRKDIITLPHEVERILQYTMDGVPLPLFSQAYEFVSGGPGDVSWDCPVAGKYLEDLGNHYSLMFDVPSVTGTGESCGEPVYSSLSIVACSRAPADTGRTLTLRGRDESNALLGGSELGVSLPIMPWDGGVEGNLHFDLLAEAALPGVRDITWVTKPVTEDFVSLYAFNPETYQLYFLAKYHPFETQPRYRRYRITSPNCRHGASVLAWCELGYIPRTHPSDILIIQNIDALKLMVMAIGMENERDFQGAKAYEQDAYRLIDEQRMSERTHDYNLMQVSPCYGFGDVRKC